MRDQTKDARLHKTNNDLRTTPRRSSMQLLEARLADAIDLGLVTKQAHWNLKGPQFIGIHLMLDKFRERAGRVDRLRSPSASSSSAAPRAARCRRSSKADQPQALSDRHLPDRRPSRRADRALRSLRQRRPQEHRRRRRRRRPGYGRPASPRSRAGSTSSSGSSRRTRRSRAARSETRAAESLARPAPGL